MWRKVSGKFIRKYLTRKSSQSNVAFCGEGFGIKVLLKSNLKRKFILVKCDICDKILREKKKKNSHNVSTKEISESVEN